MKKGRTWRGMKRASGTQVAAVRKFVYVCNGCGLWHDEKPMQCQACGRMDFINFDSRGEAKRWAALGLQQKAGMISGLERQVRFPLMAAGPSGPARVGWYVADFVYWSVEEERQIIEDFKGAITDLASWKMRHMEAQGTPVKAIIQGTHTHG